MPTARSIGAGAAVVTVAWLALSAAAATAGIHPPDLSVALGGTTAVSGDLSNGGFAAWGAAMWPVDDLWSFGVEAIVNDAGNDIREVFSGPTPLGKVEDRHRFAWGGGWRLDARLPGPGRWEPLATVTYDAVRIQDDHRGTVLAAESANGIGVGLELRRPVLQHSTVGIGLRYHHLFNDTLDGFMTAAVAWGWRFGKTP
jgi:hypothetical protein